jgi:hypothetical protein
MRTPQSGIFALGTASVSYLEFDLHPDCDPMAIIRLVADLRGPLCIGWCRLLPWF